MTLLDYYEKIVKIIDSDGQVFVGDVTDYIYPEDNESEKESIIVDCSGGELLEFYEEDISEIEVIGMKKDKPEGGAANDC